MTLISVAGPDSALAGLAAAVGWGFFLYRTFRGRKPATAAQQDAFFTA